VADRDFPGAVTRGDMRYGEGRGRRWETALSRAPCASWIYIAGLENQPETVDRLARLRPLLGNRGDVLRAVRSPSDVFRALQAANLPALRVAADADGVPLNCTWLRKPLASAGGRGIRLVASAIEDRDEPCYYQERVDGLSGSALFVADGARAALVGVSRQLHGKPGNAFAYRGSVGPWRLGEAAERQVQAIGRVLAASFGLIGIFGVDFVLRGNTPFLVEINPRYTASVEVHELATRRSLLAEHVRLCSGESLEDDRGPWSAERVIGKAIIYAPCACRFGESATVHSRAGGARFNDDPYSVRHHADIPWPAEVFDRGDPVLTLLEASRTIASCIRRLEARSARWSRRLSNRPWTVDPLGRPREGLSDDLAQSTLRNPGGGLVARDRHGFVGQMGSEVEEERVRQRTARAAAPRHDRR
jgi:predicted ATP-grasp superfamily ATP-dependent carboligase